MILFKIAEICSKLPFSKIYLATPDFWFLILYYVAIAGIVYFFSKKKIRFLKFILSDGVTQFCKKYWQRIMAVTSMMVILFCVIRAVSSDLRIYFVDVGQR